MGEWYAVMAGVTALYLFVDVGPRKPGEWIGLAAIAALWPAAFVYAAYHAFWLRSMGRK